MGEPRKILAVKERSEGNGEVGSMWVETAIFDENTTLRSVLEWAGNLHGYGGVDRYNASVKWGRLMLTVPDQPQDTGHGGSAREDDAK